MVRFKGGLETPWGHSKMCNTLHRCISGASQTWNQTSAAVYAAAKYTKTRRVHLRSSKKGERTGALSGNMIITISPNGHIEMYGTKRRPNKYRERKHSCNTLRRIRFILIVVRGKWTLEIENGRTTDRPLVL